MCVDVDAVRAGMIRGLQGIVDEVTMLGTEADKECLNYVLHQQTGDIYKFDRGRDTGLRLAYFCTLPESLQARRPEARVGGAAGDRSQRRPASRCGAVNEPTSFAWQVRLQCAPGEPSYLASIEEMSTCRYLVQASS